MTRSLMHMTASGEHQGYTEKVNLFMAKYQTRPKTLNEELPIGVTLGNYMSVQKYNTNLAAEYYVLSALHRLGAEANLTLGNKKSVDVVVVRDAGDAVTIDVKGLAGTTSWPVDNLKAGKPNHFIVFVCFLNKIHDLSVVPEVYVVPSERVVDFTYTSPGEAKRKVVELRNLRKSEEARGFRDGWQQILGPKG